MSGIETPLVFTQSEDVEIHSADLQLSREWKENALVLMNSPLSEGSEIYLQGQLGVFTRSKLPITAHEDKCDPTGIQSKAFVHIK